MRIPTLAWTLAWTLTVAAILGVACGAPVAAVKKDVPLTEQILEGIDSGQQRFDHRGLDALLEAHVLDDGRVDYAALAQDRPKLDAYLARLAAAKLAELSRDELLALLINAYNAYTLHLILDHYPTKSIRDISRPWKSKFCKLGGETVTLNFIEHNLLRPVETFDEPRIHFAVNCASVGCPLLRRGAYTGAAIDKQLDEGVRRCLADRRYLQVEEGQVRVSAILEWFRKDFVDRYGSVAKFLLQYVDGEAKKLLEARGDDAIGYLGYDWSLNDGKRGE